MSAVDDLALVVELACLTEHRDPAEQRALLRLAVTVEKTRNSLTVTNRRDPTHPACRLVDQVICTGVDDNGCRLQTRLTDKVADALHRRRTGWEQRRTGGPEAAWPTNPA